LVISLLSGGNLLPWIPLKVIFRAPLDGAECLETFQLKSSKQWNS